MVIGAEILCLLVRFLNGLRGIPICPWGGILFGVFGLPTTGFCAVVDFSVVVLVVVDLVVVEGTVVVVDVLVDVGLTVVGFVDNFRVVMEVVVLGL